MIPSKRQHLALALRVRLGVDLDEVLEVIEEALGPPRFESGLCRTGRHDLDEVGYRWVKGERRCLECERLSLLRSAYRPRVREAGTCPWCGKVVDQRQRGAPKVYCNSRCAQKYRYHTGTMRDV